MARKHFQHVRLLSMIAVITYNEWLNMNCRLMYHLKILRMILLIRLSGSFYSNNFLLQHLITKDGTKLSHLEDNVKK